MLTPNQSQTNTIDELRRGIIGFGPTTILLDLQPTITVGYGSALRVLCAHADNSTINAELLVIEDGRVLVATAQVSDPITADEAVGVLHEALDQDG